MFEADYIQQRGFMNVSENNKIIGVQIPFRTVYYRGLHLSNIQVLFVVKIDGETFKEDQIQFVVGGKAYEQKDFQANSNVYWNIDELGTLIVKKPGGLSMGTHDVEISYGWTTFYSQSNTIRPWVFSRKIVLGR
jgi:hypothetical protein